MEKLYKNYLLKYPKSFFSFVIVFMSVMVIFALRLEIDASAETLLLEGDKDLEFTRDIGKKFVAPDFLVVTYSSKDDLLTQQNLTNIKQLSQKISTLPNISSINSIINVPLLQSPPRPIKELVGDVKTILSKGVDKDLARKEFLSSPIYKQNLVSDDFKTTVLLINLKRDKKYFDLISKRDSFIKLKQQHKLTKEQKIEYKKAQQKLKAYRDILRVQNHNFIVNLREILSNFHNQHQNIELHLGGANMIADDMVEFVKKDLKTFGYVIVGLLIIILYILFKEIRWVVVPLFISTVSIFITSGFLGLFGLEITVISSNFISLQLIMNISLVVHLIVKYKELVEIYPQNTQKEILTKTVTSMIKPSFFVVITTIAGFSSLVFSNILPIIQFGWMMSIGIVISLLISFILFPIVLVFVDKSKLYKKHKQNKNFTYKIGTIAYKYPKTIILVSLIVVLFSISGATKLRVENSFIDYFKQDTQIYQGMKLIDQKLGGTTPLDVIITFKDNSDEIENIQVTTEEDEELDDFEDEFDTTEEDKKQYWFTPAKISKIEQIHSYLDSLEPIGKVLSLATLTRVGKSLNDGKDLDSLTLALINQKLPKKYKDIILTPYVNIEHNMARISTRVIDSQKGLQRDKLIKKINHDLSKMINPKYQEFKVSNLLIIYNNMLQSLFDSQIKTIGLVVAILFIMFLILFRSLKLAIIAIIANTIPVGVIFGFMGWFDIPLDMMTITIAAISIGIAVDDTIHYIHRFTLEYNQTKDTKQAILNAHQSIGSAMFYTSTIIIVGFSILVLSSFIPTIYFGILTMIAMFMAIVADLVLLPVLLKYLR